MSEQETQVAPPERTPVQMIEEETARLQEAMTVFRHRVQERLGGMNAPREVTSMLQALHIPALTLNAEAAGREITQHAAWDGDPDEYTERGLQRQAERTREKTMQWFTTLREQLNGLVRTRLITQQDADIALRDVGAPAPPPVPEIRVRFTVVGNASAPVSAMNGGLAYTDETLREAAQDELRRAVTDVARRGGFTLDGDVAIEIGITRG